MTIAWRGEGGNAAQVNLAFGGRVTKISKATIEEKQMDDRMTVAVFVVLVLLAGATLVAACGRKSATVYTEANNNDTVAAKVGARIVVTLKENPTTGYSWKMKFSPGLSLVSSKFIAPKSSQSQTQLAGAAGKHTWVVKADKAGTLVLTGIYARSWEAKTKNAASFSLTINAK